MFVFRSRRHVLIKRLWEQRCQNNEEDGCHFEESRWKRSVMALLRRLKEDQLEALVKAAQGFDFGQCVMAPAGQPEPNVVLAKLLRWPDLQQEPFELKRLSICSVKEDHQQQRLYECCNPYHWSRRMDPSPSINGMSCLEQNNSHYLCRAPSRQEESVEDESSTTGPSIISYSTNGTQQEYGSLCQLTGRRRGWCTLAYWEEKTRVGRQYPVSDNSVEVFSALPKGNGLCLATLFEENQKPSKDTVKTRQKIGKGFLLSREEDGVWLYNRTESPLFVNSPTLEPPPTNIPSGASHNVLTTNMSSTLSTNLTTTSSAAAASPHQFTVHRVPPGYSLLVFDYNKSRQYEAIRDERTIDGPYNPHEFSISFVKGWGKGTKYSRQVVHSCPCWLLVSLLHVPPPR